MTDDRRRHPRKPARFLVQHRVGVEGDLEVDYARDVSRTGLFIETRRQAQVQSTLHVQFAPRKDARLVSAFCRVTRVTEHGLGAEFVTLDPEALALIEAV